MHSYLKSLLAFILAGSGLFAGHFQDGHISARFIGDSLHHDFEISIILPVHWQYDLFAFDHDSASYRVFQNGNLLFLNTVEAYFPYNIDSSKAAKGTNYQLWAIPNNYRCSGYSIFDSVYGLAIYKDTISLPSTGNYTIEYWSPSPQGQEYNLGFLPDRFTVLRCELNHLYPGFHPGIPDPDRALYRLEVYPGQNLELGFFDSSYDSISISPHPGLWKASNANPSLKLFAAGFNLLDPFGNGKFNFRNNRSGALNFEIDSLYDYHYGLEISYYYADQNLGNYVLMGTQIMDFSVHARNPLPLGSLNPIPSLKPALEFDSQTNNQNGLCWRNTIQLIANQSLQTRSLSSDGSQFRLSYQGQFLPIIAARWLGIDTIEIETLNPIGKNGSYQLSIHQGLDGLRLKNFCGSQIVNDTLNLEVKDCFLNDVEESLSLNLYPNPNEGIIFIENIWQDASHLKWINQQGQTVQYETFKNQIVTPRPRGIYLLLVLNGQGRILQSYRLLRL